MKTEYRKVTEYKALYNYYRNAAASIPYWFDTDYSLWLECLTDDTDYDGEKMFTELLTYIAVTGDQIKGFIQFGISSYIYNSSGEKDHTINGGIIRNLYFDADSDCAETLIGIAEKYFCDHNIHKTFAFFHAFGMTCNAGHGKLHCSLPHIEKALLDAGCVKEHENVYYKRTLSERDLAVESTTSISYGDISPRGICEFTIYHEENPVGAGALVYLPQGKISYLKWIYIDGAYQGHGFASNALGCIFADLYNQGITRIDTDTADSNIIAQKLYSKTGFENLGRTRSYLWKI